AAYGDDCEPGSGEPVPEAVDVHVEGTFVALEVQTPHLVDDLPPAERAVLVGGEQEEQVELLQRQVHTVAADGGHVAARVQSEPPGMGHLFGDLVVAPQQRFDPHHQLGPLERFHQVVVHPGGEPFHLVPQLALGGEHQQRQVRIVPASGPGEAHSVQVRHHRVHHTQVDRMLPELSQRLPAVTGAHRLQPGTCQERHDQLPDVRVVIDHKYCAHHPLLFPREATPGQVNPV